MNASLTIEETLARLLAAALAGAIVGWERESHGRPAGLRTTILAGAASAVAMMLSERLFEETSGVAWRPDPARLGAGVLTGIGFLGAGTILRHKNVVRGVTTAASLWFVTVLGLVFGSGEFALGVLGLAIAVLALYVLPRLEKHIEADWYATLSVTLGAEAPEETELHRRLHALGLKVKATGFEEDFTARRRTLRFELKLKRSAAPERAARLMQELRALPGVLHASWH